MDSLSKIRDSRRVEHLIYLVMWLMVILFPFVTEAVQSLQGYRFVWGDIFKWWEGAVSYLVLFLIHDAFIIPRYFRSQNLTQYMSGFMLVMVLFGIYESLTYANKQYDPVFSMPLLVDLLLALFVLGMNLSLALLFKSQRERESLKSLENLRLHDELKYLKTQINPHFFMNMLNNIHSTIELDPMKAQDMVLELSKLMRYVLYEGEGQTTTFSSEAKFLTSYVSLMRQRYPSDKVMINLDMPENPSENVNIPPLLFIAFVENAFKHGVSYLKKSEIDISLKEENGNVMFYCRNTKPAADSSAVAKGGVGLENVRRRLFLLYGSYDMLEIEDLDNEYIVNLSIPCR